MFEIKFSSLYAPEENHEVETVTNAKFDKHPTWQQVSEHFLGFLRSIGYEFDANSEIKVVPCETTAPVKDEVEPPEFLKLVRSDLDYGRKTA